MILFGGGFVFGLVVALLFIVLLMIGGNSNEK